MISQATVFGWMVSGRVPLCHMGMDRSVSHQLLCLNVTDDVIKSFWNLESIGIAGKDPVNVNPVLQEFEKSVSMVDGRYEVALPWRPDAASRNNVRLAAIRLRHLDKRLSQNLDLKDRYDAVIHDMLVAGIVEEVSVEDLKGIVPVFYMPHKPVVLETAVSTKVHPVFDASAKGYNWVSLNACMEVSPCLLSNLTEMLSRFRRWKVAITADVEKAFLQISVRPGDRDVHRFLWNLDGEVRHMRFRRVPFGNCSSPFLLNAMVKHHLATCSPSQAVQELKDNLYMGDLLTGAESTGEACSIIHDASSVMKQASMSLSKWVSNSAEVADVLQREFRTSVCRLHPSSYWESSGWQHLRSSHSVLLIYRKVCVCDQKDCAQLFLPAVWPIGFHCSICYVGKVFISGVMVPWSTVGWRAARGVQDPVLAMGRWSWDFAELDHSDELYRCGLDWSQELSASWVWRCIPQRL